MTQVCMSTLHLQPDINMNSFWQWSVHMMRRIPVRFWPRCYVQWELKAEGQQGAGAAGGVGTV